MSDANEYLDLLDSDNGNLHFRRLPPNSLAELTSGETESLLISFDMGGFWLNRPDRMGQSEYPTLQEAKVAGDAVMDDAEAAVPAEMLREAKLSGTAWQFHHEDPVRFSNPAEGLDIFVHEGREPYDAYRGDEHLGTFSEIADAVAAFEASPTPKI